MWCSNGEHACLFLFSDSFPFSLVLSGRDVWRAAQITPSETLCLPAYEFVNVDVRLQD